MAKPKIQTLLILEDGIFPNNGVLPSILFCQTPIFFMDNAFREISETVLPTKEAVERDV